MVGRLSDTQNRLHVTWADRKAKLDDMYDQQLFYRDADQLDTLSNTQEVSDALYRLLIPATLIRR